MSLALTIQPQTHARAGHSPEHPAEDPVAHAVEQQAGDESRRITAAIVHGDSSAFGLFYDTWFSFAFNEACRYTKRDEATCLDIVQDAMLKAARSMRQLDTHADIERWLTRVVQTSALDTLRQEQRRRNREIKSSNLHMPGLTTATASQALVTSDVRLADQIEWLKQELAKIPVSDQALLHLRYALGRSLEQTGRAVGISGDAAHGKLRRIIAKLRSRSEDQS